MSRGMARPAMGVRSGGEACAAAQPAARRREKAVPRLFERLEQEEQRLKKHDGRWMDIQQSVLVHYSPYCGKG